MGRYLLIFQLLSLPSVVFSLKCYVCATGGLGEFGECKEQFQYDCTPYASKFPGERAYCRTTREKHNNGSFSVMKECISETDHYSRFPEKGYPLDEECDLIDIQGQEVAYCVCRTPLCNREPIADQFMIFEEKHPELFGDVDDSKESAAEIPSGPAPLQLPRKPPAAFAAPQVVPPAIVPVNDPRFTIPSSPDIRRQPQQIARPQLPTRDGPVNSGMFTLPRGPPVSQSGFVGHANRDPSPSHPEPPRPVLPSAPAQPVVPEAPAAPIVPAKPVSRPGPPPLPLKTALRCVQCGERGLPDVTSDCSQSSVSECSEPEAICFTRMIMLSPGQNAVEKMCVSPESLRAMFGDGAVHGECGTASQGKEHYCTCTTDECNQLPLHEQRGLRSPVALPPMTTTTLPPPPPPEPEAPVPVPELPPALPQPPREPQRPKFVAPEPAMNRIPETPRVPPTIPKTPEMEEAPQPIVPAVVHHAQKKVELRCNFCSEEGISDPTADCSASATRDCREGQTMCITMQSQVENEFRMDKKCISAEEFSKVVSEPFEEGCATADEGMINFCLCKGEKCNSQSLLAQAQSNGVRDTLEQARHQPPTNENNDINDLPKIPIREPPREQIPPVANGIPTRQEEENTLKDMEKSTEERELEMRRQKWAEADLNTSSCLSSLLPLLLLVLLH